MTVSAGLVREVARTSHPATINGWPLTIEYLIENSVSDDWDGTYYQMRGGAARKLAVTLNKDKPWRTVQPAIEAGNQPLAIETGQIVAEVLVGEIVDD